MYKQLKTNKKEKNTILDYIYILSGIALFSITLINIINN
jgi:hypothetical protein